MLRVEARAQALPRVSPGIRSTVLPERVRVRLGDARAQRIDLVRAKLPRGRVAGGELW